MNIVYLSNVPETNTRLSDRFSNENGISDDCYTSYLGPFEGSNKKLLSLQGLGGHGDPWAQPR